MSVYREGSGYRVHAEVELPNGSVEVVRKFSSKWSKRDAEAWERQRRAEVLNPSPKPRAYPTVEEFSKRWMEGDAEVTNVDSTIKEKRTNLRLHILPALGRCSMKELEHPEKIASFYGGLRKKGRGPKTLKNVGSDLHRMLACALEWGVIDRVPKFPKVKVEEAPWDFFNKDEVEMLIAPIVDSYERLCVLWGFDTGSRSGEQIAVTWDDVDMKNSIINVRQASSRGKIGPTKTKRMRAVPMTPRLKVLLQQVRQLRHLRGGQVFLQNDGSRHDVWTLKRQLEAACRRAGLRVIKRHEARHSFASNLVIAGTPLPVVQKWMGHTTIQMTMRYAHLAPTSGAEWIGALDGSVGQGPGASQPRTLPDRSGEVALRA